MMTGNLPLVPESAPFSTEQRAWLNGFLAGMFSSQGNMGEAMSSPAASKPVTILWGSQTGNCEGLARRIGKVLGGKGFSPAVVEMGEYDRERLAEERMILIVTSTYGEGEPPDNAASLHAWLLSEEAPRLERLQYSVLGLGDSNYPDFCKCAIEFDERLKALGAASLVARVDCDVDFEGAFESWLADIEKTAGATEGPSAPAADAPAEAVFGKSNPFPASVLRNYNLNRDGSSKETRHVEISLAGSGLSYEPGDALAVVPRNDPDYVDDVLAATGLSGDDQVTLQSGEAISLRKALIETFDVTNLTLKSLKSYAEMTGNDDLKRLSGNKEDFKAYAWGRQFIDLLIEYPYSFSSGAELVKELSKLSPRLYSISSSPQAHPDEVHVTVGVVRYDAHGRERKGVCSNFLADHDGATPVGIYFHHTKTFKLPENPDAPVVMVGPGTGIAPFRAFLEERAATGARGRNWLLFGDQHEQCDFLYREQLDAFVSQGVLTHLDTAFSRDQERKVYVQDRMREKGAELFQWLEEGGSFYVCGDASRMAKDVDLALRDIISLHGKMDERASRDYVDTLKKEKRYLRDVY